MEGDLLPPRETEAAAGEALSVYSSRQGISAGADGPSAALFLSCHTESCVGVMLLVGLSRAAGLRVNTPLR